MDNKVIELTVDQHVAHVQLCRAEKMNALNQAMFEALVTTAQAIKDNPSIRVVIISGQGKHFCSGLDKSNFASLMQGEDLNVNGDPNITKLETRTHGECNQVQAAVWQWRTLDVPVIAVIEGVAFGGGLQIALAADMRYASQSSQYSILEIKWGIVPDMGSTQLMRHLVRDDVIRELSYTGRIFSAQEAKEYGFVTELHDDPLKHAFEVARQMSQHNPAAVQSIKRLLNSAPYLSVADGLMMESTLQDQLIGSPNQIEAVKAALEKRPAQYKDE